MSMLASASTHHQLQGTCGLKICGSLAPLLGGIVCEQLQVKIGTPDGAQRLHLVQQLYFSVILVALHMSGCCPIHSLVSVVTLNHKPRYKRLLNFLSGQLIKSSTLWPVPHTLMQTPTLSRMRLCVVVCHLYSLASSSQFTDICTSVTFHCFALTQCTVRMGMLLQQVNYWSAVLSKL